MSVAIKIENVSKLYCLGTVGTGTISHDLNRWWHQIRGKEDPYALVGQVNDRTQKSGKLSVASSQPSANAATENCQLPTANSGASGPDYVWALRDINLEVQQGEILGIIGRNGAGKSTLLKLLSRVTAPTTGSIKTKGRIASLLEVGTGFHPELTGRENIYMNGAILGMRRHEITRQLDAIVEFSGCAKYLDTPTKRYSSGMMVRLGFAVAAHLECEILVVDEVLAVGDAEFQAKCIGKMQDLSVNSGRTILFVSHNIGAVSNLCTAGAMMVNGALANVGTVNAIIDDYLSGANRHEQPKIGECRHESVRSANRLVEFSDIRTGVDNSMYFFDSWLEVEFDIQANTDVRSVSIGGSIFAVGGETVCTFFSRQTFNLTSGQKIGVDISVDGLPLVPGIYTCGFSLGTGNESNGRQEYDIVVGLPKFQIQPTAARGDAMSQWHRSWGAVCWSDRVKLEVRG